MLIVSCLSVFVRNDGSPALSFVGMCAGAAANILLDWLFIFPLQTGVVGAAIASGVAQGLQPLWGQCYGKKDSTGLAWYFRSALSSTPFCPC